VIVTATSRWLPPPELAERALTVSLPALPAANRRPETELLAMLTEAFPAILGALCSVVSTALRRLPAQSPVSGRLPDAFAWMLAACGAGDLVACQPEPGESCFTETEIRDAFAAPIPRTAEQAVRDLLHQQSQWSGTATRLFELLSPLTSCASPKVLSEQLREAAGSLAAAGITVKCHRSNGVRLIELSVEPSAALPENLTPQSAALSQPAESQAFLAA
jgi:hypothetical protein